MKITALICASLMLTACQKNEPSSKDHVVDNTMTRYADSLKQDVHRARQATETANQKIHETEQQLQEAFKQ